MLTRILTAIIILIIVVPVTVLGGVWEIGIMFSLMCAFSIYEMLACCGLIKKLYVSIPSILVSALSVMLPIVFRARFMFSIAALLVLIPLCLIFFLFIGVVCHKVINIERLMMFYALALYITAGFTSLSVLTVATGFGKWAIVFVFAVSWCTDTFAYFGGMLFGKKKLCPNISPKKTVAGAISGTLFGTIAGVAVFWICFGQPLWGLLALPLSIVGQFGDLSASIIKRYFGVKDYGKIFPGHGGMVDRFDSIIPTAVVSTVSLIAIVVVYNFMVRGFLGF